MNEPSEMPTPRTDKAIRRTQGMFRAASAANGFTEHSRQLERDLSTLRKAAEAARVALEKIAKPALGGKIQQQIAQQALASLRSELAKTTPASPETPAPRPD